MRKDDTPALRTHLDSLLRMQDAHISFDAALADFPETLRGAELAGAPHSPWELLEHLRIAQEDILDFSRNPEYRDRTFPDDYWPASKAPPSNEAGGSLIAVSERSDSNAGTHC